MKEMKYELTPRDVLFFRDGRPMDIDKSEQDARNIGYGAIWPRPDLLYKGVLHALLKEDKSASFGDFSSLKTFGPYPVKDNIIYLPRPLDWDMEILPCMATDLPEPLKYGFVDRVEGKKKYPSWIKCEDFCKYLKGEIRDFSSYCDNDLYGVEPRTGTTLDAATGASKRMQSPRASGQYHAEYLRLQNGVSMWCKVETGKKGMRNDAPEAMETPSSFIMGGQGGIVNRRESCLDLSPVIPMPKIDSDGEVFLRWTLIAPALFEKTGWIPGWCIDSRKNPIDPQPLGTVMFPDCRECKLVGACIGKPVVFSGYDSKDGIKPTVLAVPQGSVYLFHCKNKKHAEALIKRLHLHRQSDFGPQGFGIGVCSLVTAGRVQKEFN